MDINMRLQIMLMFHYFDILIPLSYSMALLPILLHYLSLILIYTFYMWEVHD